MTRQQLNGPTINLQVCYVIISLIVSTSASLDQIRWMPHEEICHGETAALECRGDEVMLIHEAAYGSVRIGRCDPHYSGYSYCNEDVASIVSVRCSGRRSCNIMNPDPDITSTKACSEISSPVLVVSYKCVQVVTPDSSDCSGRAYSIPLLKWDPVPHGNIASLTSLETPCGTSSTPWLIDAKPDEHVFFTLNDFHPNLIHADVNNPPSTCIEYAIVKEILTGTTTTVCGGRWWLDRVNAKDRGPVEITVFPGPVGEPNYFMLEYEVFGCPDIPPIPGTKIINYINAAVIICDATGEETFMYCEGKTWESVPIPECPQITDTGVKSGEYCYLETFQPSCTNDETVVIQQALYGRMKLGRCVKMDYAIGCQTDVTSFLQERCSGSPACKIFITDMDLLAILKGQCPSDLIQYLYVEYRCIEADQPEN